VLREGAPGEVYNVGGDDERENVEIVGHILRLTGADPSLIRHVEDRAGHDRRYSLDTSKLRTLGWEPRKQFDEGSPRRSPGTSRTAPGGSRSSQASTARTTSSSNAARLACSS
jgi:nucleoside-diphosphate-sugar epimerase